MRKAATDKDFLYDFLPNSSDPWIVLGWGRVLNSGKGSYQIQVILNQISHFQKLKATQDFELQQGQITVTVGLGILRALTPGTIVRNRRIISHIHNYRSTYKTININVDLKERGILQDFVGVGNIGESSFFSTELMGKLPVILLRNFKDIDVPVIIPCATIANYYFFGYSKLIKYELEGKISKNRASNKVYDPSKSEISLSQNEKIVALVRLEKDMKSADAFKIARLAHDQYFWNKCLEINKNLIKKNPGDSFLECDLPIEGRTQWQVYGRKIALPAGDIYFVYSIRKCESKAPFDALIVSRDNPGGYDSSQTVEYPKHLNSDWRVKFKRGDILPKKEPMITNLSAAYKSWEDSFYFENPEDQNFPESQIIDERDLTDPISRSSNYAVFTKVVGDFHFTIEDDGSSNQSVQKIQLSSNSIAKPTYDSVLHCFDLANEAVSQIKMKLEDGGFQKDFEGKVLRPIKIPGPQYSILPANSYESTDPASVRCKKFCFMNIKRKGYNVFRQIFIYEMRFTNRYFYILDLEPKYKKGKNSDTTVRFYRSLGVVLSPPECLNNEQLKRVLKGIVDNHGKWTFLDQYGSCRYRTFKHTTAETLCRIVLEMMGIVDVN